MTPQATDFTADELTRIIGTPLRTRRHLPHPGLLFLAGLLLALALAVVGFFHYQPLTHRDDGIASSRVVGSNGVIASSTQKNDVVTWLEPKGLFTVTVVFTVYNGGRLPVTIERASGPTSIQRLNDQVYFEPRPASQVSADFNVGAKFFPFTVSARDAMTLIVRWSEQCVPSSAGTSDQTIRALPVSIRILDVHHTVMIPVHTFRIQARQSC